MESAGDERCEDGFRFSCQPRTSGILGGTALPPALAATVFSALAGGPTPPQ